MGIEEAIFELHGSAVVPTYRLTVGRVAVEQCLQSRRQGLETGVGVGLHPLGIKRSHFGTCQRLAEKGIKPHAWRHRGNSLAEIAASGRREKKIDIGTRRRDR